MTQSSSAKPIVCRGCGAPVTRTLVDLGNMPLVNLYPPIEGPAKPEPRFPLHARVCDACSLVQIENIVPPQDLFSDYAYFSSFSDAWLDHSRRYAEAAIRRFVLGSQSLVVEIASNDGYLLKNFIKAGVPVLGVDPAANVVKVAIAAGVPTRVDFFGKAVAQDLAQQGKRADLVCANNVFAHVPDLNDFVSGFKTLLKPNGAISIEVPHVLRLIREVQFDQIYHEHFSYVSFHAARHVLGKHGLRVFDIEEIPTHGGSLRIYACHTENTTHTETPAVSKVLADEVQAGLLKPETYADFASRVDACVKSVRAFLEQAKRNGKTVIGYGAAAKGTILLNHCHAGPDFVDYVVDRSPYKQKSYLPGLRIPIHDPARIAQTKPAYVLILAWNLKDEVMAQMAHVRSWGAKFATPIPLLRVLD